MIKCKILRIIILICFILLILSSRIFALGDWINQAEEFLIDAKKEAEYGYTMNTTTLAQGSEVIFNALLAVGTGVAIIVGAIMGIQFMTAGIDKQVEVKQALYPYIISCVILFGAFGIWKLVITIMDSIT